MKNIIQVIMSFLKENVPMKILEKRIKEKNKNQNQNQKEKIIIREIIQTKIIIKTIIKKSLINFILIIIINQKKHIME